MIPRVAATMLLAAAAAVPSSADQSIAAARRFEARLSVVPIDLTMRKTVTGSGTITASLDGSTLVIEGTFKGLITPATVARVHRGANRGLRGPAIADLQAEAATSGAINGTLTLTAGQVEDLKKGWLYIQVHSEKAPEGNLWGWLLTGSHK